MNLEYKRELDRNYMILEEECREEKDGFEIYMLEENQIPGLLACHVQRVNRKQRFCYEITSRQSLDIILERKRLSHEDLLLLLKGILRAVCGAREYLLDVNHLMLRAEYMYMNVDKGMPELCCFPYHDKPIREQFFDLAEYLLGKLDRQDRAAVELGYEIYKMAGEENCSLEEILRSESAREMEMPRAEHVRLFRESEETGSNLRVAEPEPTYGVALPKKNFWGFKRRGSSGQNSTRITVVEEHKTEAVSVEEALEDRGGTRVLTMETGRGILLHGRGPMLPTFVINEASFLIGKKRDLVDGCIESAAVSRIHARVERVGQEYYLVDLNSLNGTYVNGRMLETNERVRLCAGDTVCFAESEYVVSM